MYNISKTVVLAYCLIMCTVVIATNCPNDCSCYNQILRCKRNALKEAIPADTVEAYLTDFQPDPINNVSKIHPTWASVLKLNITLTFPSRNMFLADRTFDGLQNLTYLGIHGIRPKHPTGDFYFKSNTFYGLNSLKTLDLSGNPFLLVREVTKSLTVSTIMQNLNTLNLKDVQAWHHKPVYKMESNKFLTALHQRSIKELVLDGTNLEIDFSYMNNLCKTMRKISMKNSYIIALYGADYFKCSSLKELDLTNASVPFLQYILKIKTIPTPSFTNNFNRYGSYLFSVETLNLNNFFLPTPEPLSFDNGLIYNASGVIMNVKYLNFRYNHLRKFNVSFQYMPFPPGTEIDVSNNDIGYIHPRSLFPGKNIRKINLASNKLNEMRNNYPKDFAIFLHVFEYLEEVSLASNDLIALPGNLFSSNLFLKSVNVSGNRLHFISINLNSLSRLHCLDASNNNLRTLSERQTLEIERQASSFRLLGRNKSFIFNISGNNFDCNCDNIYFARWIKQSMFVDLLAGNKYICTYNDKQYDMKRDAYENVAEQCKLKQLKINLAIGISISFTVTLCILLSAILWHRHRMKQNRIKVYLKQLRKKNENHFLAFLSYCSEDTDFVLSEVSQKLNKEVCIKTKKNDEYICIGDKHFRPGFPVITEVMSKIENSDVAIFVISQTFCNKSWCHIEIKEAMELQKPIVLIFKEHVDEENMPKLVKRLFRQNTRCKFTRDTVGQWSLQPPWSVLVSSIIELASEIDKKAI